MVESITVVRLVASVVLLLLNGFFVTTEFAMTRVRQFDESEFQGWGLERAWQMTERLEIFLSGCQVGITITSVGLGVVGEPAVAAVIDPLLGALGLTSAGGSAGHTALSIVIALAIINLLHVVVGEQAPTYLGVERTRFVAKYGAPLLYWWTRLMWPVIIVADRIAKALLGLFGVEISRSWTEEEIEGTHPTSRSELRRQMGESLGQVGLSQERQDEVLNALEIGELPIEEVMVPTDDIVALSTAVSPDENFQRMADEPHTRYPLVGEDLSEFLGIVYLPVITRHRDAFADGSIDFTEISAPPMTLSPDVDVSDAIDQFQMEHQELALVVEDGAVVGMITVTDALESVMGDIDDPIDTESL